jgi:hypothetical protein
MTPAYTVVARACRGILLRRDEHVTEDSLKNYPVVEYVARQWVEHAYFKSVTRCGRRGETAI